MKFFHDARSPVAHTCLGGDSRAAGGKGFDVTLTLHTILILEEVILFIVAALPIALKAFNLVAAGLAFLAARFPDHVTEDGSIFVAAEPIWAPVRGRACPSPRALGHKVGGERTPLLGDLGRPAR